MGIINLIQLENANVSHKKWSCLIINQNKEIYLLWVACCFRILGCRVACPLIRTLASCQEVASSIPNSSLCVHSVSISKFNKGFFLITTFLQRIAATASAFYQVQHFISSQLINLQVFFSFNILRVYVCTYTSFGFNRSTKYWNKVLPFNGCSYCNTVWGFFLNFQRK